MQSENYRKIRSTPLTKGFDEVIPPTVHALTPTPLQKPSGQLNGLSEFKDSSKSSANSARPRFPDGCYDAPDSLGPHFQEPYDLDDSPPTAC